MQTEARCRGGKLGREVSDCCVTLLILFLLALSGCNESLPGPNISSTPVATPIIVTNEPVNPTPSQTVPPPEPKDHLMERVGATIEQARKDFPGHSSVIFLDLESGSKIEFDENARFESASLMKLVVLAELYRQFHVGSRKPEDKLALKDKHKVGGSGSLKDAKTGTSYTLEALARKMITESDNTATQMLTDTLGLSLLNESAKTLGLTGTTIERDIYDFAAIDRGQDNYISGRDAGLFMKLLARNELPGSDKMHEVLEQQKRNDMIGNQMPAGVRVAHKTGELNEILHDAGIVYAPRGAYVLVMLGDQVTDKSKAKETWARLSREVFTIFNEATPTPTPAFIPE